MRARAFHTIGRLLRGLFHVLRVARAGVGHWLLAALAGALVAATLWWALPQRWSSEGHLILRPQITYGTARGIYASVLSGDRLSTINELGAAYTWHLIADERLGRVAGALGWPESPQALRAMLEVTYEGHGILRVRATGPRPERVEQLVAAVTRDFESTIAAQNRQRLDADRILVTRSAVTLPVTTRASLPLWLGVGAAGGALLALGGLATRDARRRRRILTPLEAEQQVAVPTLAAIPSHR